MKDIFQLGEEKFISNTSHTFFDRSKIPKVPQRFNPEHIDESIKDRLIIDRLNLDHIEYVQQLHKEWFPVNQEEEFFLSLAQYTDHFSICIQLDNNLEEKNLVALLFQFIENNHSEMRREIGDKYITKNDTSLQITTLGVIEEFKRLKLASILTDILVERAEKEIDIINGVNHIDEEIDNLSRDMNNQSLDNKVKDEKFIPIVKLSEQLNRKLEQNVRQVRMIWLHCIDCNVSALKFYIRNDYKILEFLKNQQELGENNELLYDAQILIKFPDSSQINKFKDEEIKLLQNINKQELYIEYFKRKFDYNQELIPREFLKQNTI